MKSTLSLSLSRFCIILGISIKGYCPEFYESVYTVCDTFLGLQYHRPQFGEYRYGLLLFKALSSHRPSMQSVLGVVWFRYPFSCSPSAEVLDNRYGVDMGDAF